MRKAIKRRLCRYISFVLVLIITMLCVTDRQFSILIHASNASRIDRFSFVLESGAEQSDGKYVWSPTADVAGHQYVYRLSYVFSGDGYLEPGAVKITIPKHIFKARNGYYADLCELPMTEISQSTGENEFAYYQSGDNIIITNVARMSSTGEGLIDVAYTTTRTTYYYQDMSCSDVPYAEMTLTLDNVVVDSEQASAEQVYMDTEATLNSVAKKGSTERYSHWLSEWGPRPEDADQYYYVLWTITSEITATQPFWFELVEDFHEQDSDIVGYKLFGKPSFTNSNRGYYNSLPEPTRYDQVLTRHLKSSYTKEQYSQINNVTGVLTPADEPDKATSVSAEGVFSYDKPKFIIPTEGYNAWKYGNTTWTEKFDSAWDAADYELTDFYNGDRTEISGNLKYCIDTIAYPYPKTLLDNADPEDYSQYGKRQITYTLTDDRIFFNDDITTDNEVFTIPDGTEQITCDDYEIEYLLYNFKCEDAVFNADQMRFDKVNASYAQNEILFFEGKFGHSNEWVPIAEYHLGTRTAWFDQQYVSSMTDGKVVFKENCTAYRIKTTNSHFSTSLVTYPYFKLKRSESILQKIASTPFKDEKAWMTNIGSFDVRDNNDRQIFYKEIIGRDYVVGYNVNSSLAKKLTGFRNDNANKYATLSWKVDFSESYISNDGVQYVTQENGVFYDLLPSGGEVNLSTVAIQTEEEYIDPSKYEVSTISNFRDTGRTMLVVRLKESFQYATLTYDMIYSWESVVDYGENVLNSVAYESGNDFIANGLPDTGGTIADGSKMIDLDPDSDAERFVYTESGYRVSILLTATSGLTKTVKKPTDYLYTDSATVRQNGDYIYKLRYSTSGGVTTDQMIIFDSIENFTNEDVSSVWWGTLQGVDISQPLMLGAQPVVYYSSISDLDIDQHHDLNEVHDGAKIWQTATEFGNIENAKAVAIDLRKDINGNDFTISASDSVVVLLYMKAPPGDNTGVEDPKTYNGVYASYRTTDELNHIAEHFYPHGYSQVTFRIMADVNIRKVNTEDLVTPIKGISFSLSGTSDYGTRVDQTVMTDIDGQISFTNIEKGTYSLTELEGSDEFLPIDTPIVVVIDENGTVSYNGQQVMEGVYYTIGDTPRYHADVSFFKRDMTVPQLFIKGARFELTGTSDYGHEVTLYAQSDDNGKVAFRNVELGTYTMRETTTDSDHILDGNIYTISVTGNELYSISVSKTEGEGDTSLLTSSISGVYSIYNEHYHSFTIQKEAYADGMPVAGAVFELKGDSYAGHHVELTRVTNAGGQITFTHMESGVYSLQEIFAPYGFGLDPTVRTVTINKDDTVTIEDTTTDSRGYFVIINKENGSVTITKKWFDGLTNEEREAAGTDAVIHLTPDRPKDSEATFKNSSLSNQSVLLNNVVSPITKVTSFKRWPGDDDAVRELIASGKAVKLDNGATEYSIYAWFIDDTQADDYGTVYWWSDAKNVYYNPASRLLRKLPNCKTMDLSGLDTSRMTSMDSMFYADASVETLDIRGFDTSKVTNMNSVFSGCSKLVSVDLRKLDTSSATTMASMFYNCSSLAYLDLTGFDTPHVTNMSNMFYNCSKLPEINVSGFDTSNVTNMAGMFQSCASVTSLDLKNFDTALVTNMSCMFCDCSSLRELDVSSFDTSCVTNMQQMFQSCKSMTEYDLSNFDTSSVTTMYCMFYNNTGLTTLDLSSFDTSSVTNMQEMLRMCTKMQTVDVSSFDTSSVTTMYGMFRQCSALQRVDVSNFDPSSVTNLGYFLQGCTELTEVNFGSQFDATSVTTTESMFSGCNKLQSIDLSGVKTASLTTMNSMSVTAVLPRRLNSAAILTLQPL